MWCKENHELLIGVDNSGVAVDLRLLRSQAKYNKDICWFTLKHSRVVSSKAWKSHKRDWACAFRTGMKAIMSKAFY